MTSSKEGTRVTIVGVGPGDNSLLTLKARQAIEEADLVAGFETVLNVIRPFAKNAELCSMAYRNQEEVLDYAVGKVKEGKSLVVCAWGDLNVSAKELLDRVRRRVDHALLELTQDPEEYQNAIDCLYSKEPMARCVRFRPILSIVNNLTPEYLVELLTCPYKVVRDAAKKRLIIVQRRYGLNDDDRQQMRLM